ncbi:hypothetical protein PIB30_037896 [Stylosanthes scabra]|uniref:GRF-type domain-containing protein n=1 Tax=Stylosanthes scabra TaxID=79078 RepID=A0ABU6ZAS1_9FABA|nr:hypothetical protein [Stylosanthes scabra]
MGFYASDPKKIYFPQPNRGTCSSYFRFHSSLVLIVVTCRNKPFFKTLTRQFPTEVDALTSLFRQSRKHNSYSSSRYPSEGPNLAFVVLPRFHHPLRKPISAKSSVSIGSAQLFAPLRLAGFASKLQSLAKYEPPIFVLFCYACSATYWGSPLLEFPYSNLFNFLIVSAHSMATRCRKSSNESTGSGDSASGGDRVCHCGLKAPLKVSHSYANPGREYYSCPTRRCKWFKWAGPPIEGASSIDP